jgi:hypothetical protein
MPGPQQAFPKERADAPPWRRFALTFVAVFLGLLAVFYAAVILIDPFDAGYFPSILGHGVVDPNEQTNIASRARDPRFNAAIFGNSHGQLLDPARLSPATGLDFIQLYALGSGPREQMLIMRYFLRRHPHVRAIVLAADRSWCTHDPRLPREVGVTPFPTWLYSESRIEYLENVLSARMIPIMRQRVLLALGKLSPIDPVGYSDYEIGRTWSFKPVIPKPSAAASPPPTVTPDTSFPAIDAFTRLTSTLPAETSVVIVMPPFFYTILPPPGSQAAVELALCKGRLARLAESHGHGAFIDLLIDSPMSRDPANFMDHDHVRAAVARVMEERIAAALASAASATPTPK